MARGGSNRMIPAAEVAELLDIHLETLYRRWKAWGLRAHRIGREIKFRERDLEAWIDSQALSP